MWWKGPGRLSVNDGNLQPQCYEVSKEIRVAVINEEKRSSILHQVGLVLNESVSPYEINEERYSSYTKLIRVNSWCIRFINNLRRKNVTKGHLNEMDIMDSKNLWTKYIQKKHFPEVIKAVDENKYNSIKYNLGVQKDEDGILRCFGRFQLTQNAPKLLPKSCYYANLIIMKDHRRLMHAGVSQTLSEIRNEHWVVQGRPAVRKMLWPFQKTRICTLPGLCCFLSEPAIYVCRHRLFRSSINRARK